MPVRKLKPVTPSQRFRVVNGFDAITTDKPEKSLLVTKKRTGGRNNHGKMTSKYRGGGHKKRYRIIDFKRDKFDVTAEVKSIEYDPNRTAFISLLEYKDGEKRYIIAQNGLKVGQTVLSGESATPEIGNAMPLASVPLGSIVHNVELTLGKGGQIARAAGTYAQVIAKEGDFVTLKLPSNEVRLVHNRCYATLGQVGNVDAINITLGKAGRKRWLGKTPKVLSLIHI